MLPALLRRLLGAGAVLLGISVLVFLLFFATPGADPAARIAGRGASPETLAQVRREFGLDRPLPVQYFVLMRRLFVAQDLASYVNPGLQVVPAVLRAAPVSLSLVAGAAVLWVAGGVGLGLLAASARSRVVDRAVLGFGLLGASVPPFWLGEVVNLVTQSRLHATWLFAWVPPLGYVPLRDDPVGWFKALAIPWVTLASLYAGLYGRVLRAGLAEAYREDYVRTARAKGLSERRVLLVHAFRPALVAFVSLFGLDFGALVGGGALLTEVVFGLRGVGKLTYDAMRSLDLPVIMATVLYAAFFVVLANLVVDLVYALLDPRVRAP
jgi:peptide/nickel transport system permease protein